MAPRSRQEFDPDREPTVRVNEIASVLGCNPDSIRAAAGDAAAPDWKGELVVSTTLARRIVEAHRHDAAERDARERENAQRAARVREWVIERAREIVREGEEEIRRNVDNWIWSGTENGVPSGQPIKLKRFAQEQLDEIRATAFEQAEREAVEAGL